MISINIAIIDKIDIYVVLNFSKALITIFLIFSYVLKKKKNINGSKIFSNISLKIWLKIFYNKICFILAFYYSSKSYLSFLCDVNIFSREGIKLFLASNVRNHFYFSYHNFVPYFLLILPLRLTSPLFISTFNSPNIPF
jgi:hypothetical protein